MSRFPINQIVCGPCEEVMRDWPDVGVGLVLTDPPYGIDYQSAMRVDKSRWRPKIANDVAPCIDWLRTVRGGRLACFCRWDVEADFIAAIRKAGYKIKSQVIWDKMVHGMGDLKGAFAPQHENILYATKERWTWPGNRPKSVLRFQRVTPKRLVHPNEKLVELLCELVSHLSNPNDLILDPFCGSGTTCIAAKILGRRFVGIDINPEYCAIARARLKAVDSRTSMNTVGSGHLTLRGNAE